MDGVQKSRHSFCPNNEISTVSECVCIQLQFFKKCICVCKVWWIYMRERARGGAEEGQEMKGRETPSSFSIRAYKLSRGWGLTVSQWVLRLRLLLRATRPISHAANSLWQWAYVPLIIKSIEMSYRPEQTASVSMFPIQTHFSFALSIQIMTFIVWV